MATAADEDNGNNNKFKLNCRCNLEDDSNSALRDSLAVKLVIVGGKQVGKSALTVRYLTKRYIGEYQSNSGESRFIQSEAMQYAVANAV